MRKPLFTLGLICIGLVASPSNAPARTPDQQSPEPVNPVVQWNRVLLRIVRTPGAQPATVRSTRSFAIMHAAVYDAVNAIDRRHKPYAVRLPDASDRHRRTPLPHLPRMSVHSGGSPRHRERLLSAASSPASTSASPKPRARSSARDSHGPSCGIF